MECEFNRAVDQLLEAYGNVINLSKRDTSRDKYILKPDPSGQLYILVHDPSSNRARRDGYRPMNLKEVVELLNSKETKDVSDNIMTA
jgi:hypothetical protein